MSRIKSIILNNFKFFKEEGPIELDGKHLLLFGENGSGKSSIYWGLYTLFESSLKNESNEITKYFGKKTKPKDSLVNIHAIEVDPDSDNYNSSISIETDDDVSKLFKISVDERDALDIMENQDAKQINYASDFINYKGLYSLQNFWHSSPIDLFDLFTEDILKHVQFSNTRITRSGITLNLINGFDIWRELIKGPEKVDSVRSRIPRKIYAYKGSREWHEFNSLVNSFNDNIEKLIDYINIYGVKHLKNLGYNFEFQLIYKRTSFVKKEIIFNVIPGEIDLKITNYEGQNDAIFKPHSFLNEAKIAAIGISIKLAVISQKLSEDCLKFLVFDDFMISLDMTNRDRVIDYLLDSKNELLNSFQLLFLTHDRGLYDFIIHKIKQKDSKENWTFRELYVGTDDRNLEFPQMISPDISYYEKAKAYYSIKDYTACSLFIRKELERIVLERLPSEYSRSIENNYHNLVHLWKLCTERYEKLGMPFSTVLKNAFEQTKLMLLNPQAHHNLSTPVYRSEIDFAFQLIEKIETNYPIPFAYILLTPGMVLIFKHPLLEYSFEFEILSDFYIDKIGVNINVVLPKCSIINYTFNNIEFWNFKENRPCSIEEINKLVKRKDDRLDKLKSNIKSISELGITDDMFFENTTLSNGLWSLSEIINKSDEIINKLNNKQ